MEQALVARSPDRSTALAAARRQRPGSPLTVRLGQHPGHGGTEPSSALAPPAQVQAGFFDDLLGTAVPGVLGAASSLLSGDSGAALGQVRQTGAGIAPAIAQHGASALGGLFGGQAGEAVSSLGGPLGQGLSSVISGEATVGQAARQTGAVIAPGLAQHGASALGGLVGGQAGEAVSSLGAPLGQGLSSVISGEATPGQAAGGLLAAAPPAILSLIMSLLNR